MYSKYQIINRSENCFQNINSFPWIKSITILIHLKYRYYDSLYLELLCLLHPHCKILLQPKSSSFSSLVPIFRLTPFNYMPPQLLNIPNHMASHANQIYYQAVNRSQYLIFQTLYPSKS